MLSGKMHRKQQANQVAKKPALTSVALLSVEGVMSSVAPIPERFEKWLRRIANYLDFCPATAGQFRPEGVKLRRRLFR